MMIVIAIIRGQSCLRVMIAKMITTVIMNAMITIGANGAAARRAARAAGPPV